MRGIPQITKNLLDPKAWIQDDIIEAYLSLIIKENQMKQIKSFLCNCFLHI